MHSASPGGRLRIRTERRVDAVVPAAGAAGAFSRERTWLVRPNTGASASVSVPAAGR